MSELRYTLTSDGSTDRALLPVLNWLLIQHLPGHAIQAEWADLRRLPSRPAGLAARIRTAVDLYPCDLLFVHRDAEREPRDHRVTEIRAACLQTGPPLEVPVVPLVTVRMQEAWLLFDEFAIRQAAGNPNGREPLQMPRLRNLEALPDPKSVLYELLREASGLHGRRRQRFDAPFSAVRVGEFVQDFSPLRSLTSFQALEEELSTLLRRHDWNA